MPRVGKEAARVGGHANKAAQQALRRQNIHLLLHTVFVVQKPPGRTVLHLTGHRAILEVTHHRGHHRTIARVKVVEHGLGQRAVFFQTVEEDKGQFNDPAEVLWATGAALMIRSKDYWEVGGLDGRFFAHSEEIDLCWRLRIRGRKVVCLPDSHVYHVGGGTLPKANPMKTFLNFRNNLTMLYKCLPDDELRGVMRWRWFLDYLAAWEMLILQWNIGDFKAVYRARRAFR